MHREIRTDKKRASEWKGRKRDQEEEGPRGRETTRKRDRETHRKRVRKKETDRKR